MSNDELIRLRDEADMIVSGYAFSRTAEGNIRVLDLNEPHHALMMSPKSEVYETTMDDIELSIVMGFWERNGKYMEVAYA